MNAKYLFTTLNARDEFLDILLALWRMATPDNFSSFIAKKDADEAADYRARASSVSSAPHADAVKTYHVETTSSAGEHVEYESTQQVKDTPAGTKTAVSAKIETKGHPETQAEGVEDLEEVCMDITFPCEPKKIFDLWYRDESFVDDLWNKLEFTGKLSHLIALFLHHRLTGLFAVVSQRSTAPPFRRARRRANTRTSSLSRDRSVRARPSASSTTRLPTRIRTSSTPFSPSRRLRTYRAARRESSLPLFWR